MASARSVAVCGLLLLVTILHSSVAVVPTHQQLTDQFLSPLDAPFASFLQTEGRLMDCQEELGLIMGEADLTKAADSKSAGVLLRGTLQKETGNVYDLFSEKVFRWEAYGTLNDDDKIENSSPSLTGAGKRYQINPSGKDMKDADVNRNIYFLSQTCSHRSELRSAQLLPMIETASFEQETGLDSPKAINAKQPYVKPPAVESSAKNAFTPQPLEESSLGYDSTFDPNLEGCPFRRERPFRRFAGYCISSDSKATYVWSFEDGKFVKDYIDKTKSKVFTLEDKAPFTEAYVAMQIPSECRRDALGAGKYNKEGFLHDFFVSILEGLSFMHFRKGMALLNFKPDNIIISSTSKKPIITDFSSACVFGQFSSYPCWPGIVTADTAKALYEPAEYYGFDPVNPYYRDWWKADLFLLGTQLLIPMLTGSEVSLDDFCSAAPGQTPPPPPAPNAQPDPKTSMLWGQAVKATSQCALVIHSIFDYFNPNLKQAPGCNVGVRRISNWKKWAVKDAPWNKIPEDMGAAESHKKPARKRAFENLWAKLTLLHKTPAPIACPRYTQTAMSRVTTPLPDPPSTPAAAATDPPQSLWRMLVAPEYRFMDFDGKVIESNGFAPELWRRRKQVACKWINLLLDLITCPDIRPSTYEILKNFKAGYGSGEADYKAFDASKCADPEATPRYDVVSGLFCEDFADKMPTPCDPEEPVGGSTVGQSVNGELGVKPLNNF